MFGDSEVPSFSLDPLGEILQFTAIHYPKSVKVTVKQLVKTVISLEFLVNFTHL